LIFWHGKQIKSMLQKNDFKPQKQTQKNILLSLQHLPYRLRLMDIN